jgi:MSHA biogenesis protein MshM
MYTDHFGMQELPFTLTPNTHFFLAMPSHQEALNLVLVALSGGDGFIKVVGEVGTGKTMVCRMLLNQLEKEGYQTAYMPNPHLSPAALRRHFAEEIGVDNAGRLDEVGLMSAIQHRLIELAQGEHPLVLLVDEAQAMPEESIEALRLLTNLETESRKLFQVVLFGQPELDDLLAKASLRQLKQRITFSCRIRPITEEAVEPYLQQRVTRAGYSGLKLFRPSAARLIHQASNGIPRVMNILAHKALMVAYGKGDHQINPLHVKRAILDTETVSMPPSKAAWWLTATIMALATGSLLFWVQSRGLL